MDIDVNETKGLKIGDRIESSYLSGKCPIKQRIREDNVTAHKNSDTRFSA